MEKKRKEKIIGIVIILVIIAAVSLIFIYFQNIKCSDISCFNSAMSECKRASFINELDDASWLYTIKGKSSDLCTINVKLLQVKKGTIETKAVEGLDMNCQLALGYAGTPNEDLSKCSGELKEGLQDLLIKKMHAYILSNVGQIGAELNDIV